MRNQTVKFFRLIFHLGIIIILYSYWSSVIPLTATLDTIPIPITTGLSLLTLVKALLVTAATIVGVRNLPGLLEFTVLRLFYFYDWSSNDSYTICQYGVIGISLIAVSNPSASADSPMKTTKYRHDWMSRKTGSSVSAMAS